MGNAIASAGLGRDSDAAPARPRIAFRRADMRTREPRRRMPPDQDIPRGWSYNPSTWSERLPIISLALVGVGIASYLALWQYEAIDTVWEPFFDDGTRKILDSPLSYVLPISDAALGALAYLADALAGAIGGRRRWARMPWIVILFAILVGPLGLVSIGLVIAQPVVYAEWCTLCLLSAAVSVAMIGPAMDEALASLQHLRRVHDTPGRSLWRAFWGRSDDRTGRV